MKSPLIVAIVCLLAHGPGLADDFMHGASRIEVVETMGSPLREIETGQGVLMFYGSVFLEIEDESVIFINVLSQEDLDRKCSEDAARGIYWGGAAPIIGAAIDNDQSYRSQITEDERNEWLERKQRNQDRVIETRVRRFLLTRTFVNLVGQRPFAGYRSISPYDSKYGYASVSTLGIKDSRSKPVPTVGEDAPFVERHIDFSDFLLSPVLAQADIR